MFKHRIISLFSEKTTISKQRIAPQLIATGLALLLGLLLTVSLLSGPALAQGPVEGPPGSNAAWLILDSARPVEDVLPGLLEKLAAFKAAGRIVDFDPAPQASAPGAVPGVRVIAMGETTWLETLPGVLAAVETLPPAPREGISIQAATIITGRVTEAANPTNGIAGVQVEAYDGVTFINLGSDTTDANGDYELNANSPYNQVKLSFSVFNYAPEWFDNKPSFGAADIIATSGLMITGKDAQLDRADAVLTGTVVFTPGGQPVDDGVLVDIYRASDGTLKGTTPTNGGAFTIANLAPGAYKVFFNGPPIAPEWYQDKPFAGNFNQGLAAATPVTLTSAVTQNIAAIVERTVVITGRLTDAATGLPIAGGTVHLYDQSEGDPVVTASTDAGGLYTLRGIPTGNYKVWFGKFSIFGGGYNPELYDNLPSDNNPLNFPLPKPPVLNFDRATLVMATAGQTRTGINAALTSLDGVAIAGRVTASDGAAIAGALVELWQLDQVTGEFFNTGVVNLTTPAGMYTFTNVANGVYRVRAGARVDPTFGYEDYSSTIIPHTPGWFDGATTLAAAANITITNGISQTGQDVQLALGGCLAGRIVDSRGVAMNSEPFQVYPVEGGSQPSPVIVKLSPFPPTWSRGGPASLVPRTDEAGQGEFRACGLPTGAYILSCDDVDPGGFLPSGGNRPGQRITATVTAGQVTEVGVCTVEVNYGVQLNAAATMVNAQPGEQVSFTVTVTNTGNIRDTFSFDLSAPQGWTASPVQPVELDPGQAKEALVQAVVPGAAGAGNYPITLTARSTGDPAIHENLQLSVRIESQRIYLPVIRR